MSLLKLLGISRINNAKHCLARLIAAIASKLAEKVIHVYYTSIQYSATWISFIQFAISIALSDERQSAYLK